MRKWIFEQNESSWISEHGENRVITFSLFSLFLLCSKDPILNLLIYPHFSLLKKTHFSLCSDIPIFHSAKKTHFSFCSQEPVYYTTAQNGKVSSPSRMRKWHLSHKFPSKVRKCLPSKVKHRYFRAVRNEDI